MGKSTKMKISIDGGALCSKNKYGNYIFTENLLKAIGEYDKKRRYSIYSFCELPKGLKLGKNLEYKKLLPKLFWSSIRVPAEELSDKKDYFLALNQAIPTTKAKVITFLHGLSFYFYPEFYLDSVKQLKSQLDNAIRKSDWLIVSSVKVKDELLKIYPKLSHIQVIPFGLPYDMEATKTLKKKKYFLYVGMDNKIKNIDFLKEAFRKLKKKKSGYKLVIAKNINDRKKLRDLYSGATAYLTASHYESFNFPVIEALSQNTPVIALNSAIIPEYREYINIARDKEEFVQLMEKATEQSLKKVSPLIIMKQFSWKKYFDKLDELLK